MTSRSQYERARILIAEESAGLLIRSPLFAEDRRTAFACRARVQVGSGSQAHRGHNSGQSGHLVGTLGVRAAVPGLLLSMPVSTGTGSKAGASSFLCAAHPRARFRHAQRARSDHSVSIAHVRGRTGCVKAVSSQEPAMRSSTVQDSRNGCTVSFCVVGDVCFLSIRL